MIKGPPLGSSQRELELVLLAIEQHLRPKRTDLELSLMTSEAEYGRVSSAAVKELLLKYNFKEPELQLLNTEYRCQNESDLIDCLRLTDDTYWGNYCRGGWVPEGSAYSPD